MLNKQYMSTQGDRVTLQTFRPQILRIQNRSLNKQYMLTQGDRGDFTDCPQIARIQNVTLHKQYMATEVTLQTVRPQMQRIQNLTLNKQYMLTQGDRGDFTDFPSTDPEDSKPVAKQTVHVDARRQR